MPKLLELKDLDLANVDGVILDRKKWSNHPGDAHLNIVLVWRPHNDLHPYVVWGHNIECKGYFGGEYCKDLEEAAKAFKERGKL